MSTQTTRTRIDTEAKVRQACNLFDGTVYNIELNAADRSCMITRRADGSIAAVRQFKMRLWQENLAAFLHGFHAGAGLL